MTRKRTTRNHRPPFDPRCEFVHSRSGSVGGLHVIAGEQVEKSDITDRRLRQMYDARMIQYAPGQVPGPPPKKPLAVGPTDLRNPGVATPPEKKAPRRIARVRSRRAEAA